MDPLLLSVIWSMAKDSLPSVGRNEICSISLWGRRPEQTSNTCWVSLKNQVLRDGAEGKKILTIYYQGQARTQNCNISEFRYENDIDCLPILVKTKYRSNTLKIVVNLKQVLYVFTFIIVWISVEFQVRNSFPSEFKIYFSIVFLYQCYG